MSKRKKTEPHLRASKILTLSEVEANRAQPMRTSEDAEAQAYADTLRWLDGKGPRPERVCFLECIPGRTESEPPRWFYQAYVIDDHIVKASKTFLIHELLNRFTPANRKRTSRKDAWQAWAKHEAEKVLKKPGSHRLSVAQVAMKLCGVADWDPAAKFTFVFRKDMTRRESHISAATLYRFLRSTYSSHRMP